MSNQATTSRLTGHRVMKIAASAVGHLVVTTVLFAIFCAAFMTEQAFSLMGLVLRDSSLGTEALSSLVIMYGLAACTWALLFITFQLFKANAASAKQRPALQRARGTVVTETLIILPIFFLLTFGLAQMALNSVAGLLTTLGTFHAARTAAVWGPEVRSGSRTRANISEGFANEKVRLAAAGVIAPAVPNLDSGRDGCQQGFSLPRMLKGLGDSSGGGISTRDVGDIDTQQDVWSFIDALGYKRFRERGPAQLVLAYCNIEVNWDPINNEPYQTNYSEFDIRVRYHHPAVMPLVGPIFARDPGAGRWQTDYVTTIRREYRMSSYLTPNDCGPLGVMYPLLRGDCN